MKKPKRNITIILVLCLAGLILGRTVTLQMWKYLNALDAEVVQLRDRLVTDGTEIKQNAEFVRKWQEISGFQQEPVVDLQNEFMRYLQSLSLVVFNTSPATSRTIEESKEFQILSYPLDFSANLEDLVGFLSQLDSADRLLRVDRLEVTKKARPTYYTRYESSLLSTKDLSVRITVSIPAGQPAEETVGEKVFP